MRAVRGLARGPSFNIADPFPVSVVTMQGAEEGVVLEVGVGVGEGVEEDVGGGVALTVEPPYVGEGVALATGQLSWVTALKPN